MFTAEHHGSSGKWHPTHLKTDSVEEAKLFCQQMKSDGYGVRLLCNGVVVMTADWQNPIVWR